MYENIVFETDPQKQQRFAPPESTRQKEMDLYPIEPIIFKIKLKKSAFNPWHLGDPLFSSNCS